MPCYTFACKKCEERFEYNQTFNEYDDGVLPVCLACGGEAERTIESANFKKLDFPFQGMYSKAAGKFFNTKTAMENHWKEKGWNWKATIAEGLY